MLYTPQAPEFKREELCVNNLFPFPGRVTRLEGPSEGIIVRQELRPEVEKFHGRSQVVRLQGQVWLASERLPLCSVGSFTLVTLVLLLLL